MSKHLKFSWIIVLLMAFNQAQAADELFNFNGEASSISDYTGKGKWTIVMMWASDCHVCNAEAHAYNDFHEWNKDKNATVLGISLDGQKKKPAAEKFIEEHSLSFTNLIGESETIAHIFSEQTGSAFVGTPSFMVYAPDGALLGAQAGAIPTEVIEGFIKKHAAKYSNATAAADSSN